VAAGRQEEHLRDFNLPTMWSISIHEVYPGHFLQAQHSRQVESKVRKSTLLASNAFVEGWAHYCEQMMMEAGFRRGDATLPSRTAGEATGPPRALRRRHPPPLRGSLGGAGMRFFRDEAFLEEATARREPSAGTFDPGYIVYSLAS
jgi:hypothetical protein